MRRAWASVRVMGNTGHTINANAVPAMTWTACVQNAQVAQPHASESVEPQRNCFLRQHPKPMVSVTNT